MRDRWLFPILLAAPFAFALFFWDLSTTVLVEDELSSQSNQANSNAPQTIAENAKLMSFNATGKTSHWLHSDELVSTDTDGLLYIEAPKISIAPDIDPNKESSWDAHSNEGIYNQKTSSLRMSGEVVLIKKEENQAPVTMNTEKLEYFPDQNLAQSDEIVVIETEGHRIETVGISIDFQASVYKFNARVRSSHDPI